MGIKNLIFVIFSSRQIGGNLIQREAEMVVGYVKSKFTLKVCSLHYFPTFIVKVKFKEGLKQTKNTFVTFD
jgi:hypothetical protein